MQKCKKCGEEKFIDEYYKARNKSGYATTCKECVKARATENRNKRIEYYREYDRKRGNRQTKKDVKKYRENNPNKYKAHNMVNNAIRDRKLFKEPCEICGCEIVHAHHDDYAKPLNVRWLCPSHHKEWHKINGEGKNP